MAPQNRATPGEILAFRGPHGASTPPVAPELRYPIRHNASPQLSAEMALSVAALVTATRLVVERGAVLTSDELAVGIAVALSDAGWAITPLAPPTAPEAA